jgi:hypothetical protein
MYGLTRATTTLLGAAVAGFLIWLATQFSNDTLGGYWTRIGLVAGAGLVMALSQLLGGWTKWGWPRFSVPVLLVAFVPIAIVCLWVILAGQPVETWLSRHVASWSGDIGIRGLVSDLVHFIPVLAFGGGLVFGFAFDTSGPVVRRGPAVTDETARRPVPVEDRAAADEPLTAERGTVPATRRDGDYAPTAAPRGPVAPPPEAPPRARPPE